MAWQYRQHMPRVGGRPLALGVVVSKKVDKRAVVRNRLRRRIKEGFRQGPWPALAAQVQAHYQPRQALWVVVVGREAGRSVKTSELQHHIAQAAVHLQRWAQQAQQPPAVGS
jgi:ribonuclease P protein component